MTVLICSLLSVALIAAGYVYVCFVLNDVPFSLSNTFVLRLTPNKGIYLAAAVAAAGTLMILSEYWYLQSLLLPLLLILVMFPIAAIDLRQQRIPNQLLIVAVVIRAVFWFVQLCFSAINAMAILADGVLAAVIFGGFFLLLLLIFKNSIGMGDIKLFAVIGLYRGIWGTANVVFYSLLASFIISVLLLMTKKKSRKDAIPMGPSILIGTLFAVASAGI